MSTLTAAISFATNAAEQRVFGGPQKNEAQDVAGIQGKWHARLLDKAWAGSRSESNQFLTRTRTHSDNGS